MTSEFLFFANLVLALRLSLLLGDAPVGARRWALKAGAELIALALFLPGPWLWAAAGTNLLVNVLAWARERRGGNRPSAHLLFGLVQLLALSVWFSRAGGIEFRPEVAQAGQWLASWSALGSWLQRAAQPASLLVIFGFLLAANEANLVIRWMLDVLKLKPRRPAGNDLDVSEYARGRVIGLFERALIYSFVLSGQFGAIGFTLAAKGFTRFKELEDRSFAEYVLIGTLLSSSLAMSAALLVRLGL